MNGFTLSNARLYNIRAEDAEAARMGGEQMWKEDHGGEECESVVERQDMSEDPDPLFAVVVWRAGP